MALSPEESAKFWPIYHEYEKELFAVGDRRVEITRAYVNAQASGSLDNGRAAALSDDWFRFESQRLDVLRKYNKRITDELSPIRAAQFTADRKQDRHRGRPAPRERAANRPKGRAVARTRRGRAGLAPGDWCRSGLVCKIENHLGGGPSEKGVR